MDRTENKPDNDFDAHALHYSFFFTLIKDWIDQFLTLLQEKRHMSPKALVRNNGVPIIYGYKGEGWKMKTEVK